MLSKRACSKHAYLDPVFFLFGCLVSGQKKNGYWASEDPSLTGTLSVARYQVEPGHCAKISDLLKRD